MDSEWCARRRVAAFRVATGYAEPNLAEGSRRDVAATFPYDRVASVTGPGESGIPLDGCRLPRGGGICGPMKREGGGIALTVPRVEREVDVAPVGAVCRLEVT